jgi:hypothetical protein
MAREWDRVWDRIEMEVAWCLLLLLLLLLMLLLLTTLVRRRHVRLDALADEVDGGLDAVRRT